jgi:tetratricopeptide (TPR) repeat protein
MAMGGLAEAQMRQRQHRGGGRDDAPSWSKASPQNLLVKQLRGQVAAAGGKYDEARTLLEEVVSAQPQNYQARTLLGIVNVQQGNLDQAEMHLAASWRISRATRGRSGCSPRSAPSRVARRKSMAGVKTALEQTGNDPTMLAMAGRLSLASGDREQALSYLAQAAENPAATRARRRSWKSPTATSPLANSIAPWRSCRRCPRAASPITSANTC